MNIRKSLGKGGENQKKMTTQGGVRVQKFFERVEGFDCTDIVKFDQQVYSLVKRGPDLREGASRPP